MRTLLLAALVAALVPGSPEIARDVVIHAGTPIDGVSRAPRRHDSIRIHDDEIVAIEAGCATLADTDITDLSAAVVIPGFIDCRVHIGSKLPGGANGTKAWLTHNDIDRAFDGALFMRAMLQQGFTAARDVGGGDDSVAIRNAINAGKISGPRLWVSLEPLGPTACHGDPRDGIDAGLQHAGWDQGLVDTPDEARLGVRQHKRYGADLIKIMPSGAITSCGDGSRAQTMTIDEMRAAVETAQFDHVTFVMKGGKVCRQDGHATAEAAN